MKPETAQHILANNTSRRIRAYNPSSQRNEEIEAITIDFKSHPELPGVLGSLYEAAHAGKLDSGETGLLQYVRNSVDDKAGDLVLTTPNRSFDDYRVSFSVTALQNCAGIVPAPSLTFA